MIVAYFIAFSVAAEVYMPVFYKLHLVSAHEYLELRFGKAVRWTTSLVYCFQMIVYIALALYAPALAFSQVSGLPIWVSVLSTGLVTTFYTALGGIRAVVWTDVFQLVFSLLLLLTVVSVGVVRVGGMEQLWRVAYEGLRVQSFDTVSSGVNSLATVLLEDIYRPLLLFVKRRDISERKRSLLAVIFSIVVGLCTIGMSFVFMVMGPRVLQFAFQPIRSSGWPNPSCFHSWNGYTVRQLARCTGRPTLQPSCRIGINCWRDTLSGPQWQVAVVHGKLHSKTVDPSWSIFHLSYLYYTLVCVCTAIVIAIPFSAIFNFNSKHLVPGQLLAWQTRAFYRRLPSCFPNQWEETPDRQPRDDIYRSMDPNTFLTTRTLKDFDGVDNEQFSEE
ncbi:hypothetical protein AHF37_02675 [Paragonimus kellicotti]|nr:hypothetical protein AHF37_02675 [Paragonimus kellicotti]